jgi:hypothetical protein
MTRDDGQALTRFWQQQPNGEDVMNTDTIRARAAAFDRRLRGQDLASIAAFSIIAAGNAIAMAFERTAIEKLGDLVTILAALYVLSYYWRARDASPAALGTTSSLQLVRQKIARRQAMYGRTWHVVLLFVPGILLSTVGKAFVSPPPPLRYVMIAAVFGALVLWIEWLNRREARRLAAELEGIEE